MHNKKRQNSSGACAQTILELSSCKGGRSYAQSPYLRCMPIGIAHHQDEIIHLAQFPFPLFLYKLHILNTKRKGEANSTWWFFIISLTFEPLLPSPFTFFPKYIFCILLVNQLLAIRLGGYFLLLSKILKLNKPKDRKVRTILK